MGYALRWNHGCVSMCSSYQFQMNKKEGIIGEFEMDFKKSFCCGFNLNNDEITSVLCKHVMLRFVTTSRSENRCGKWLFFCLKLRVSIWRTGRHTPTKNSLEYPPGGEAEEFMCFASPTQSDITVSLVFICCLVYSSDIRTSSWLQSSSKLHGTCFEKFYLPLVLFKFNDRGHDLKFFLMW